MRRLLPVVALVLVVAVAALGASLLLLRSTGGADPVGDLSPVAPGVASTQTRPLPPPTTTDDHHHDGGGEPDD